MNTQTILVTGSTGKTGRRIVGRLRALGRPFRSGSRSARPSFDWEDRETWDDALAEVTAAYVCYYPDVAAPGASETIQAFVEHAANCGVRRLVLLSGRGEPEAQRCEEIVRASGLEWTVLRASWFAQNFSESFLLEPVLGGEVALPAGDVGEPFIDAEDIADAAVAALTQPGHSGQLYELTGPRLLTFAEAVAEIGRASGRVIRYVRIPVEDYAASLRDAKVPDEVVEALTYLFVEVLDGRNASVADGVQRALGRAPRDFRAYAEATAAAGIWDAAPTPAMR